MDGSTKIAEVLKAAIGAGSPAYNRHCGEMLERFSDLATRGEIEELGLALQIHATLHPQDRRPLVRGVPPAISNGYWIGHLALDQMRVMRWCGEHPDWSERLTSVVSRPAHLAAVAGAMAAEIERFDGN